ncbi:MAG: hypothetical protein LQ347_003020 [Umbilicaria vellea]|nr:MAG: hypothetical protein LQ347_003020 [Umbilicaria vellea]
MGGIEQYLGVLEPEKDSFSFFDIDVRKVGQHSNIQLAEVKSRLFHQAWLDQPDADGNFPTNGDRFAAQEISKRRDTEGFTKKGFILQAIAAGWHHKSAAQLKELADKVGRDRILVMHGTIDNMITYPHAEVLVRELGGEEQGVTKYIFEERGHVLMLEERKEFTRLIVAFIEKTEAMKDRK